MLLILSVQTKNEVGYNIEVCIIMGGLGNAVELAVGGFVINGATLPPLVIFPVACNWSVLGRTACKTDLFTCCNKPLSLSAPQIPM